MCCEEVPFWVFIHIQSVLLPCGAQSVTARSDFGGIRNRPVRTATRSEFSQPGRPIRETSRKPAGHERRLTLTEVNERSRVRVPARTLRTPEGRGLRRFLEPGRKFRRPCRIIVRQRSQIRVCPPDENLTGVYVYRGHNQIPLETPSTHQRLAASALTEAPVSTNYKKVECCGYDAQSNGGIVR